MQIVYDFSNTEKYSMNEKLFMCSLAVVELLRDWECWVICIWDKFVNKEIIINNFYDMQSLFALDFFMICDICVRFLIIHKIIFNVFLRSYLINTYHTLISFMTYKFICISFSFLSCDYFLTFN